ncbi:hypothetical protein D3C72_1413460 [compost metagenome]
MGVGVVALGLARGAQLLGVGEAAQRGLGRVAARHCLVHDGAAGDFPMDVDAVAVDQAVAFFRMHIAMEIAFLGGQPGNEVQVGFTGLHAVFARQVRVRGDLFIVGDVVALEDIGQDFRHGQLLIDAPVRTQRQARQRGFQHGAVARAPKARVALLEGGDDAMDVTYRRIAPPQREERRLVQHGAEVDGGVEAGQVQLQPIGLGQGFVQREFNNVEFHTASGRHEGKAQIG